jgi:hypothetical protein
MSENQDLKGKAVNLQIQLDEDIAQGMYVNLAIVNHNETEFVLDFIYVQPQQPRAKVRARIITSPKHTKRLLEALQDNIGRYEKRFGIIDTHSLPPQDEFVQ